MKFKRTFSLRAIFLLTAAAGLVASVDFEFLHAPIERIKWTHGLSESEIYTYFGPPDSDIKFEPNNVGSEQQVIAFRHASTSVIRELRWTYHSFNRKLWLEKREQEWVVIYSCRFKSNVKF